jgi:hypothetical protein
VIVANPPWDAVKVDELRFFTGYIPGIWSEKSGDRQRKVIRAFAAKHPQLDEAYEKARSLADSFRDYLRASYVLLGTGDVDLYKAFVERFVGLARERGTIGVVLPRSAFLSEGASLLREHLLTNADSCRVDFLVNKLGWVFEDIHPQYTIALVAAELARGHRASVSAAGPVSDATAFTSVDTARVDWMPEELRTADYFIPLTPEPAWSSLFRHYYRVAPRLDERTGDWLAVPWREFDATLDRQSGLLAENKTGWPVLSGDAFDLWNPNHGEPSYRLSPKEGLAVIQSKRQRSSVWRKYWDARSLADEATLPQLSARILIRQFTRATDSRTVRACLVPPKSFAVGAGFPLLFPVGDAKAQAFVLGVLCSLPFDWCARRRVEANLNFFILNALPVPRPAPHDPLRQRITALAGRLAAVDQRYAAFAAAVGVEHGPIDTSSTDAMVAEIDALVAALYRLNPDQLEIVMSDFTIDAVPHRRRAAIRQHFGRLQAE